MLADKPDIVLVELGANDALRGTDPAVTEKNLDAIVEKLKAAGVTVWLAGMLAPRNLGSDYVDGVRRPVQADRRKVSGAALSVHPRRRRPGSRAFIQADGIHPNPKGAQVVADKLLPFVTKNLDDYAAAVHRPARP